MKAQIELTTKLSIGELAQQIRKSFNARQRADLAKMIQEEDEDEAPTKEQILNDLKNDLIALKNGTLETRPLQDLLDEL
jgi:hypothetical protein